MTRIDPQPGRTRSALLLGLVTLLGAACTGGAPPSEGTEKPIQMQTASLSTYHTTTTVLLRDRLGNNIAVGSATPYSPERTCGGCHDVSKITEGYHFQQGKGFSNTNIYVADNYNLAKPWLLSDGMYGKW
jgi:hypothetical protein